MSLYKFPLKPFLDAIYIDKDKFGFNEESADKFNFAIIKKTEGNITYEEFWILSNCYYDYDIEKFKSVNNEKTCFGIQIQANGAYPGEAGIDNNNVGINVWRHAANNSTQWNTFGTMNGWYNAFMLDSYGGMTIGGAGFEVDGNGIFPYTRLTSSGYKDSNDNEYYLLGLLDNAYHPTTYDSWQMDDNSTYAWFFGFRTPKKPNEGNSPLKNNANTEFVIMYNDTSFTTINNKHKLDIDKWHTVFSANMDGIKTINKLQDNYKGKNVVIDAVTGGIAFEDLPTLSDLSTGEGELSIADIDGLADAIEASFKPQVISNITSAQVRTQAAGGNLGSAFTELFRQSGRIIDENTIYFVPNNNDDLSSYDEFLYMPSINRFELIGSTQITLPTIADNLTTNDSTKVLSAKQGYNLEQNKLNKKQTNYKGKNVVVDSNSGDITFDEKNNHTHSQYLTSHQSLRDIAKINTVHSILTAQADNTILADGDIYTLMENIDKTRTTGQLYTESYFMTGQSNNSIIIDEYKYGYNIITINLGNIEISQLNVGQQSVIQTSIEIPPSYANITFEGTTKTGDSDIQIKIDTEGKMYATLTRKGTSVGGTHILTAIGIYVPI